MSSHQPARLWSTSGTIDRGSYLLAGSILLLVKYAVDRLISAWAFGRPWSLVNYWPAEQAGLALAGGETDRAYFQVMLLAAVPFIWLGVALTLRRLRALGWPLGLVALFFVPAVNFLLFAVLSLVRGTASSRPPGEAPAASRDGGIGRILPSGAIGSAASALMVSLVMGIPLTVVTVGLLKVYGVGLFVGLPFSIGLIAAVVHGYHQVRSPLSIGAVCIGSVLLIGFGLLAIGFEGGGCLLMAFPIWFASALIGAVAGYSIQQHARDERELLLIVVTVVITLPALLGAEYLAAGPPPVFAARTAVDVAADPAEVWDRVIAFPDLPPPAEWVFRLGVAYPTGATIQGRGVGAERRCVFSTGSFIEPIEVWDEPWLLRFTVSSNPPSMREWTPHGEIHPPHLEGFLVSRAGQFALAARPDGGTRLEGTTWYSHGMWPASYWRLWSDYAIHRIHLRVLEHVRRLAEGDSTAGASAARGVRPRSLVQ